MSQRRAACFVLAAALLVAGAAGHAGAQPFTAEIQLTAAPGQGAEG
jgi:energy-converting hydrogenase Eha subunit H